MPPESPPLVNTAMLDGVDVIAGMAVTSLV
jgi:hypothetical protein